MLTTRPEFGTLNHHAVVGRASVVWGYGACVERVLLDMLFLGDDGAWHLSHRTARGTSLL